jgi:glycosyltransferase involved in cell wall biosynthesis
MRVLQDDMNPMICLVIPVYKNEANLPDLLAALIDLSESLITTLHVAFVVDGSPDKSYEILDAKLDDLPFPATLLLHSRNFGSFAAVRTGFKAVNADYYAVMAADLQEPTSFIHDATSLLVAETADVVCGERQDRSDGLWTDLASTTFWALYKKFVMPEMPYGGVDIFACNRQFRDVLLAMEEKNSSLIGQVFWMGFRRKFVQYIRQRRSIGKSGWTLQKKITYMLDSIFAFTDLPIRLLMFSGSLALIFSTVLGLTVIVSKIAGLVVVPGFAMTILVVLFFGSLNIFGLGIVGTYTWRTYENTKVRPLTLSRMERTNTIGMRKESESCKAE